MPQKKEKIKEMEHIDAQEHFSECKECQKVLDRAIILALKTEKQNWHALNNLDFEMYKAKWKAELAEKIEKEKYNKKTVASSRFKTQGEIKAFNQAIDEILKLLKSYDPKKRKNKRSS